MRERSIGHYQFGVGFRFLKVKSLCLYFGLNYYYHYRSNLYVTARYEGEQNRSYLDKTPLTLNSGFITPKSERSIHA